MIERRAGKRVCRGKIIHRIPRQSFARSHVAGFPFSHGNWPNVIKPRLVQSVKERKVHFFSHTAELGGVWDKVELSTCTKYYRKDIAVYL